MLETSNYPNEYLVSTDDQEPTCETSLNKFWFELQDADLGVSTPEWLSFLNITKNLTREQLQDENFFYVLKQIAQVTLIKDSAKIAIFSEIFDNFFISPTEAVDCKPELKDQLDITELIPNQLDDTDHDDNETSHGGQIDQHNDILNQQDQSKIGGGQSSPQKTSDNTQSAQTTESDSEHSGGSGLNNEEKAQSGESTSSGSDTSESDQEQSHSGSKNPSYDEKEATDYGNKSSGKGNAKFNVGDRLVIHSQAPLRKDLSTEIKQFDYRNRYERRPDQHDIGLIISKLRKKIETFSNFQQKEINIKRTVNNFAQKHFQIDYKAERDQQPEIILLIDVGGPVDKFRPLIEDLLTKMTSGLTKLKPYYFHNQIYGYVWPQSDGNKPKPNSLINIKDLIDKNKKVIIYGDAQMSYNELHDDNCEPEDNDDRIRNYQMDDLECLDYIKKHADKTVWINPLFKKDWSDDDYDDEESTVFTIGDKIDMFDLTVGGFEDAITYLIEKE